MKDIIITEKRIKKELRVFVFCFLFGVLANVGAILYYKSAWTELFTSLHYVLIATVFIYLVSGFIRVLYYIVKKGVSKNKKHK